jgi:nicotinamidase-related amidase
METNKNNHNSALLVMDVQGATIKMISDLEVVLRSCGIQHLILSGIATGGVVLSTLREAADKDYKITVLSDCCADRDEEVHRVLTTKVFPRQADVITSKEWCADN